MARKSGTRPWQSRLLITERASSPSLNRGTKRGTELVKIPAPWYQWMPLDFVSDNFLPRQVNDRHEICWQMTPQGVVPQEKLQERADSLRSEAHIGQ